MAPVIFQRIDIRHFIRALSNGFSHGELNMFEAGYGLSTAGSGANKDTRATQIVQHIWGMDDADQQLIELLNQLYVEDAAAEFRVKTDAFLTLESKVLNVRGVVLGDNGYELPDGSVAQSATSSVSHPNVAAPAPSAARPAPTPVPVNAWGPSVQPTSPQSATSTLSVDGAIQQVFIVHGRDTRPVEVLRKFLGFLGLAVMSWSDATKLTGQSQPHTYDIVKAGIEHAAAVIVIFSPDEEARLKPQFAKQDEGHETVPGGQSRQNVTLEAGMAFAIDKSKTIFVKSAPTRPISDIEGFNWVNLTGEWDNRAALIHRLEAAGARTRPVHQDLNNPLAGPFKVVE